MPSDDREQQFERGLARHLRGGSADAACPDAEILAAYHERTLAPDELEQWKKHIAGCARCQETLALVESSEVALEEEREKEAVEHLHHVSTSLHSQMASVPTVRAAVASGGSVVAMEGAGALKSGAGKKSKMLRWAAPVGAIAAVLILWVSLRHSGNSVVQTPAQNPVQVAENRESRQQVSQNEPKAADEGMAAALVTKKTVPPGDYVAHEKDAAPKLAPMIMPPTVNGLRGSAGAYARRDNSVAQDRLDKQDQSEAAQGKLRAPMMRLKKNEGVAYGSGSGMAAGAAMPATAVPAPAPPPVAASDAVGANAASAKVDTYAPLQSSAKAAATARAKENKAQEETPPSSAQTDQARVATAPVDSSSTSQTVTAERKQDFALNDNSNSQVMKLAPGVAGGNVISAPTGKQRWRLGLGGLIEHTNDGGKTWKAQNSGVAADLISGTAPSEKTCWVAGKAGTLLLTSDGGEHWTVLRTPLIGNLARVQATDEKHATIWSSGDNLAYVTDNGGLSWAPASGTK